MLPSIYIRVCIYYQNTEHRHVANWLCGIFRAHFYFVVVLMLTFCTMALQTPNLACGTMPTHNIYTYKNEYYIYNKYILIYQPYSIHRPLFLLVPLLFAPICIWKMAFEEQKINSKLRFNILMFYYSIVTDWVKFAKVKLVRVTIYSKWCNCWIKKTVSLVTSVWISPHCCPIIKL